MAIVARDPVTAKVDDRADFIRNLLDEYPAFIKSWENDKTVEFKRIAKEYADGDIEVEQSVYSSFLSAFDDDYVKKDIFYQSIFLMCYSYYESCIALLSKNVNAKERIKAICRTKSIILSKEAQEAIDYIQGDINDIRNNICHNNFGTFRKSDVLNKISAQKIGLEYNNATLTIHDPQIITDVLDKMHMVLHELCEKLGYKSFKISKS